MIHDRNYHRKMDWIKAIRKKRICDNRSWSISILSTQESKTIEWYNNLHQYSKNKIHCSCPLCRARGFYKGTNSRIANSVSYNRRLQAMDYIDFDDLAEVAF